MTPADTARVTRQVSRFQSLDPEERNATDVEQIYQVRNLGRGLIPIRNEPFKMAEIGTSLSLETLDFPRRRSWIGTIWHCLRRETSNQAAGGCDQGR